MNEEAVTNPFQDSLNYVVIMLKDYIDTLPPSSKIAVTNHAQQAINKLQELITNTPRLEHALQEALKGNNND